MEELKSMFDYTVTPQYLVADKEVVDAGQPPKFRSRERPNTTDSFHKFQQDVSRCVWIKKKKQISFKPV
jgi:hypothetical protein